MRFSLADLARRQRNIRRSAIVLPDIRPPATLATNLYRAAYQPAITLWTNALPGIVAEYERTLAQLTTDAPADIQARLDAAASEFERLFILLGAGLREWAVRTETWQRGRWRGALLSATGIDVSTLIGPAEVRQTVDAAIQWNVSLIRDVSAEAQRRIANAVFAAVNQRKPARELAAELREAVAMSRRRSVAIAADQASKLTSALADERRRQAGIDVQRWRHSGKLHPRVRHQDRDGNLYSESAARVGTEVRGQPVQAMPEASDLPGRPPYCGCRFQGVLVFD